MVVKRILISKIKLWIQKKEINSKNKNNLKWRIIIILKDYQKIIFKNSLLIKILTIQANKILILTLKPLLIKDQLCLCWNSRKFSLWIEAILKKINNINLNHREYKSIWRAIQQVIFLKIKTKLKKPFNRAYYFLLFSKHQVKDLKKSKL